MRLPHLRLPATLKTASFAYYYCYYDMFDLTGVHRYSIELCVYKHI